MTVVDLPTRILEVLDEHPALSDIEVSRAIFGPDAGYHYLSVYGELIRLKNEQKLRYRASDIPGVPHWYRPDRRFI